MHSVIITVFNMEHSEYVFQSKMLGKLCLDLDWRLVWTDSFGLKPKNISYTVSNINLPK